MSVTANSLDNQHKAIAEHKAIVQWNHKESQEQAISLFPQQWSFHTLLIAYNNHTPTRQGHSLNTCTTKDQAIESDREDGKIVELPNLYQTYYTNTKIKT